MNIINMFDIHWNFFDFRTLLTKPNEIGIFIGYDEGSFEYLTPLYFAPIVLENNEILISKCQERADLFCDPCQACKNEWTKHIKSICSEFIRVTPLNIFHKLDNKNEKQTTENQRNIQLTDGFIKKEFLNNLNYELDTNEKRVIFGNLKKFSVDFGTYYYENGVPKVIEEKILNCWSEFEPVIVTNEGVDSFDSFYSENKYFTNWEVPEEARKIILTKLKTSPSFIYKKFHESTIIINKKFLINETLVERYDERLICIKWINKNFSITVSKEVLKTIVEEYIEEFKQYEGFDRWYLTYEVNKGQ